jgi:arylsulfatase A-like enzyme
MREQLADYCAEVNRFDDSMKSVLATLAARGYAANTLVVFAGDNGAALPHGKGSLYDPGSNVPLVVRWPGTVRPGGESRTLLSNEDIGPTLLAAAGLPPGPKMSGISFLTLLRGEPYTPRTHVFVERGPHGSAPVTVTIKNSGYDLSRSVRSDRYKFIYNCTPWIPYSPVDSAGGAAWREMTAANEQGTLAPGLRATYFTTPRPVYELYDLEADPSELKNLSGTPAVREVEHKLRVALTEKMMLDFDYLPLPDVGDAAPVPGASKGGKASRKKL